MCLGTSSRSSDQQITNPESAVIPRLLRVMKLKNQGNEDQHKFFRIAYEHETAHQFWGNRVFDPRNHHAIHSPPLLVVRRCDLRKATADGEEVPEHLGRMRESIMKQCGGLPLAKKVLGSFLSSQRKEGWPLILEKRLFHLMEDQENTTMQILKLSFDYLTTSSIKKWFAYLSIFAKDAQLYGEELIELWMAEGFLQQDLRSETVMEKIGDRCLTILLERVECFDGTRYTMHDLVHDLAQSVSKHESIHLEKGKIDNSHQVRYLALGSFEETPEKTLKDLPASVRTLFLESGISDDMISKFKCLHVLKLNGINKVEELPISVGKLKHLRYIGLQYSIIKMLPESLCNLYNLQTLHVERCRTLKCLPDRMCNLISLRHLHYFNSDVKFQMPKEMGRLTCLQTLKFFNAGKEKGYQIEELECFKDLRGELEVQAQQYCKGNFRSWDPMITTFPGLSLVSYFDLFLFAFVNMLLNFDDEWIMDGHWVNEPQADVIWKFFCLLAVCHTAIPGIVDKIGRIAHEAESSEKAAFVVAAREHGFEFYKRTQTTVS